MADPCAHAQDLTYDASPSGDGCQECLRDGTRWMHLRMCQQCGHIGCCDSSPGKHATAHYGETEHPLIRSFEPGESWFWCYPDEVAFKIADAPAAPSYS